MDNGGRRWTLGPASYLWKLRATRNFDAASSRTNRDKVGTEVTQPPARPRHAWSRAQDSRPARAQRHPRARAFPGGVLLQERGQRGLKIYPLHAPEVECIRKGKAHKPYEFGVNLTVSVNPRLRHVLLDGGLLWWRRFASPVTPSSTAAAR